MEGEEFRKPLEEIADEVATEAATSLVVGMAQDVHDMSKAELGELVVYMSLMLGSRGVRPSDRVAECTWADIIDRLFVLSQLPPLDHLRGF